MAPTPPSFWMVSRISDADYDIDRLQWRAYGEAQAASYAQMWDELLASPQTGFKVIQSPW